MKKQILQTENYKLEFKGNDIYVNIVKKCNSFKQLDCVLNILSEEIDLRDINTIFFKHLHVLPQCKYGNKYKTIIKKSKPVLKRLDEAILLDYYEYLKGESHVI